MDSVSAVRSRASGSGSSAVRKLTRARGGQGEGEYIQEDTERCPHAPLARLVVEPNTREHQSGEGLCRTSPGVLVPVDRGGTYSKARG